MRHITSGGRYPVLRTIGILYVLAAAVALVGGILVAGWALFAAPYGFGGRLTLCLGALAATYLAVLSLLAVAELLKLFIDIERNSRLIAQVTPPDAKAEESAEVALVRGH